MSASSGWKALSPSRAGARVVSDRRADEPGSFQDADTLVVMRREAMRLAEKQCVPCRGGIPPLEKAEIERLHSQIPGWNIVEQHHLSRVFEFPDFRTALAFVNRVGAVAEQEGHHPDLFLSWGKVVVQTWTHKINGLTGA